MSIHTYRLIHYIYAITHVMVYTHVILYLSPHKEVAPLVGGVAAAVESPTLHITYNNSIVYIKLI